MKPLVAIILLIVSILALASQVFALEVGSPAPDIAAVNQDGNEVKFADVYAKGITLVYFYPKADTPGCTAQACSLRDSYATLTGEGLQILGVSRDTPEAQKAFQEKFKLPFPLIADTDGNVAKAFGVVLMGDNGLTSRESFIIKDGKIAWLSPQAKTAEHAAEVQAAINALQ